MSYLDRDGANQEPEFLPYHLAICYTLKNFQKARPKRIDQLLKIIFGKQSNPTRSGQPIVYQAHDAPRPSACAQALQRYRGNGASIVQSTSLSTNIYTREGLSGDSLSFLALSQSSPVP